MLLIVPVLVATVLLAVSGQLVLYIHPRYVVFTVALTAVATVFVVAAAITRRDHDHADEDDEPAKSRLLPRLGLGVAGLAAVLMVVLPPATLSSETAAQRDITGNTVSADAASLEDAATAPTASFGSFTVLEWASLLRQTQDPVFFSGKPVDVVGFVTPSASADVFYVSRFKITCCAVDAAPTAIPVYLPGWQDQFGADAWVQVAGEIGANPSSASTDALAVLPESVTTVEQPDDPYLY